MDIIISQGHYPPANPGGITVVIDVIRAFTTAQIAFQGGVRRIHLVATAPEALAMKAERPELLLSGEINALPIDGFDFGNSPWEMQNTDLRGRELVQRTTNGVIATLRARDSEQVLVAGLINAEATARHLRARRPERVVLVASHPTGDEDVACAEYIRSLLGGPAMTFEQAAARTRNAEAADKFYNGSHPRLRADDIELAASNAGERGHVMVVSYTPNPAITVL
ncbi:MAG: 2-phosphosulfolactate phosphatase [Alcanivoracaceae bacterium]|nr:2-phosphosulfolactate phosphatase [Alcanivoracaceae bacterium]